MKSIIYDHTKHDSISIPYYLKIEGGQGHGENYKSGKYKFVGTYLNPSQTEGKGTICLDKWCEQKGLKYVYSETIEELIEKLKDFKI